MKSFCVIMVQLSGVIRIELSAAINALHHSSSLRDASWTAVAVYQKGSVHSFESKLSMVLRRVHSSPLRAPHGGLSPNKSKKEK